MKTNNILAIFIATSLVLIIWVLWVSAYNSYNKNHYRWNQLFLDEIPKSDLTTDEENLILDQYREEKVAYDLYNYFYELYGNKTFSMIANSENQHMQAVKSLIDRYSLETPTDYWKLKDTYNTLKKEWEKSLNDALNVWIKVEMLDIEDMVNAIKNTDNDDLKQVFLNIGWASYNHLRAFARNANTNLNFSKYLSNDELNTRWSLSFKLADMLESEWVSLPEYDDIPCNSFENSYDKNYSRSWRWSGRMWGGMMWW